jgi:hypothetical protein
MRDHDRIVVHVDHAGIGRGSFFIVSVRAKNW